MSLSHHSNFGRELESAVYQVLFSNIAFLVLSVILVYLYHVPSPLVGVLLFITSIFLWIRAIREILDAPNLRDGFILFVAFILDLFLFDVLS